MENCLCACLLSSAAQEEVAELFPSLLPHRNLQPVTEDAVINCLLLSSLSFFPNHQRFPWNFMLSLNTLSPSLLILVTSFSLHPFPLYILFISFFPPTFSLKTHSPPKTIITSLAMQHADMLILQKELNPTAQYQQIIPCKASHSHLELLSFTPEWPLKLMQEMAERWKEKHI